MYLNKINFIGLNIIIAMDGYILIHACFFYGIEKLPICTPPTIFTV